MNWKRRIGVLMILTLLFQNLGLCISAEEENLALGKPVFGSTEWDGLPVSYINDGDENTYWSSGSVTLNGKDGGFEYVAADLGKPYLIHKIVAMSARGNDNPLARSGWIVQLSNDPSFTESVAVGRKNEAGAYLSDLEINLEPDDGYRYVRVVSPNYFLLSELMVYGEEMMEGGVLAFDDAREEDLGGPVSLMQALGIMQGISQKEFGVYQVVSRAQAAEMVLKMMKMPSIDQEQQYFQDVPQDAAYAPWVNGALLSGVIAPGETFRPQDTITPLELMNMIEMAIGYGEFLEARGGYPNGTILLGNELGLLKNTDVDLNGPVNRGTMAQILYNTLTMELSEVERISENGVISRYEKGDTLLRRQYGMTIETGIVTGNTHTTLTAPEKRGSGFVQIGGKDYQDDQLLLQDSLGKNVSFLVEEKEPDIVVCGWENTRKNVSLHIDGEDVESIENGTISYDDGKRVRRQNIREADVIVNGIAQNDWTWESLRPDYGYIDLLDNDNDGAWEVAFVHEVTYVVVDYVSTENQNTVIGGLNGVTISFEACNLDPSGLEKNTLVLAAVAADHSYCQMEVVSRSVTGLVEELSQDFITVSGTQYQTTEYYQENGIQPKIEDCVTLILDQEDQVVWIPKTDDLGNLTLGLIQGAASTGTIGGKTQIRMFLQEGSFQDFDLAERVYVDGSYYNGDSVLSQLGEEYFTGRVAGVKLVGSSVIYIDTDTVNANEPADSLRREETPEGILNTAYCQKLNGFYDGWRAVMPAMTNGLTLVIPVIGQDVNTGRVPTTSETTYNSYFAAKTVGDVFYDLYVGWGAQKNGVDAVKVVPYNFSEAGYPEFIVKYEWKPTLSYDLSTDFKAVSEENANAMLVKKTTQSVSASGDICFTLTGIDLDTGEETTVSVTPDITKVIESYLVQQEKKEWLYGSNLIDETAVAEDLGAAEESRYVKRLERVGFGDIVQYTLLDGQAQTLERILPYDPAAPADLDVTPGGRWFSQGGSYPDYPYAHFGAIYAKLTRVQDGAMTFVQGADIYETLQYEGILTAYLCSGEQLTPVTPATFGMYTSDNYRIFIYTDSGTPKLAVIYEYQSEMP